VPRHPTTDHVRGFYERAAGSYDRTIRMSERLARMDEGRRWVAERAAGDTLEIGVGTGLNLAHYPADVRLTGVDLSPAMLALARRRAQDLNRHVELLEADAQAMSFPDGRFDTVVFSLCLCSIPDDRRAIREGARVLRPGGRLLVIEHVRSPNPVVRAGERLLEPLTLRFQHDHLTREPLEHLEAEGLRIDEVRRWAWGIMESVSATKPAEEGATG
jgi:ubiquinone/menaquinone biosynthesis C-methylase UbiE